MYLANAPPVGAKKNNYQGPMTTLKLRYPYIEILCVFILGEIYICQTWQKWTDTGYGLVWLVWTWRNPKDHGFFVGECYVPRNSKLRGGFHCCPRMFRSKATKRGQSTWPVTYPNWFLLPPASQLRSAAHIMTSSGHESKFEAIGTASSIQFLSHPILTKKSCAKNRTSNPILKAK